MPTLRFEEASLVRKINRLSKASKAAFAATVAQRLLPAYAKFFTTTGRGNLQVLQETLDRLWSDINGDSMSTGEVDQRIETCTALIPREDEGEWVDEQAAAEDAASALVYALRCLRNGDAQEAARAARRAYEALDHYVINRENIRIDAPGAEAQVLAHLLIQAEIERQQRDIDDLLTGEITMNQLRERAKVESATYLPEN